MGKANTKSKQIKEIADFGLDDRKLNRDIEHLLNTKIHRLILISEVGMRYSKSQRHVMLLCDCNQIIISSLDHWKRGNTKSCGCLQKEIVSKNTKKHGYSGTLMYKTYMGMMGRCNSPNHKDYPNYGGRGIQVCERWSNGFEYFLEDMGDKTDLGMKDPTIERKDVNGDYCPENCIWLERSEQSKNRRNTRKA